MLTQQELVREMNSLKRFAMKLTRNSSDADDLLQATLLKSLEHADSFQRGTHVFGWTSRILYNTFVSQYRQRVRFDTQHDPQVYIDQMSVDATQENSMELALVLKAVSALSPEHQDILQRVCIDGLAYADVADELGVPVGTVRSRLSRARAALQDVLQVKTSALMSGSGEAFLQA
ncbi:MAG: sigma-70 family RNA polymerase sigma factor [Gammaproteobacteria bacterium]